MNQQEQNNARKADRGTRANKTRRMVTIAMFAALAYAVMLVVHITIGGFLTLDIKDAVMTLCGLYFGPVAALLVAVLVPLLEMVTVSTTGVYGLVMNIIGSVSFSVTASLIYKYKKTFAGALVGLLSGAAAMTALMLLFNLIVTPRYFGMPVSAVRDMIPGLLLPFNLTKAAINVGLVLLLYKSLSTVLKKARVLPRGAVEIPQENKNPFTPRTLLVSLVGLLLVAGSLVVIFTVLHGKIGFGK